MLDSNGFDLWADGYDKSVRLCEEADEYPFAGYKDVLNEIYGLVHEKNKSRVLDIGFGTGILTKKLYDDGYSICGIDFSDRMLEIAKEKMPGATLIRNDITQGLPDQMRDCQFDYIVSTYAFHHLTDAGKVAFLTELMDHLFKNGMIIIGDVAFETREQLTDCRERSGDGWDADEIYLVFDEIRRYFEEVKIEFRQISPCAGILTLRK